MMADKPFWRITLLLYLSENAFGLIVDAMRTCRQLAVAFYLLLPTHITCLLRDRHQQSYL